jgi:salicylate hydroxylase
MKALVIGGGIGGLTAGLCLHEAGIDVELHERNPVLTEVGAGIQISPNGFKVLQRLGLGPGLEAVAFRPQSLDMRMGQSGAQIFSIPIREQSLSRYGAPYLHVHRADAQDLLAKAFRERVPGALHLARELTSISQDAEGVTATFADGTSATGDVLIGADGIHSAVRRNLFGDQPARFTCNVAWRIVVPADDVLRRLVPPSATVWVGPGRHVVTYYLRRGELVNFVGVVERDGWEKESWTEPGSLQDLQRDYQGWASPVTEVIARAKECFRWALFDRDPLGRWSEGRATLLGDACHPMLPFLAQGAVMAIEDAWALSRHLAKGTSIASALSGYEVMRQPRTSRVQLGARRQMGVYHQRSPLRQLAVYGPMWLAANVAPSVVNSLNDWLYSYDVTGAEFPNS